MRLTELRNDDCEILLVGPKQNNGEFDWFPVLRLEYTDHWGDSPKFAYHASVNVVSPDEARASGEFLRACQCCDQEPEDVKTEQHAIDVLMSYGTYAVVWQDSENNKQRLMRSARQELRSLNMLFGFYMDNPVNAIGSSGWDAIRGDITAGLRRLAGNE